MLKFRNVAQKDLGTYRCRTPSDHKIIFRLILDVTYPVSSEKIGKEIFFGVFINRRFLAVPTERSKTGWVFRGFPSGVTKIWRPATGSLGPV